MTDDTRELIEEARRFDTVPAEYAVRLLGSHSLIRRLADALEASLPTEDDREALAKALFDADAPVVGYERRYPDEGNEDVQTGQEWRYYLPMADRLAAGFRRSPVPPKDVACPHWEEGQITMRRSCTACAAKAPVPPETDAVPRRTRALTFAFDVIQQLMMELLAAVPPVTEETVTTVEELDALPVGTVVEDAFAATCIKTEGDRAVLGWHRVTSAVERGCHWHYPFVPARVLYRPDTEGDNRG